ncbi:hypothetical protein ACHAXN_000702 [Cyclotella atomus]
MFLLHNAVYSYSSEFTAEVSGMPPLSSKSSSQDEIKNTNTLRLLIAVTAYDLNQFPHFNRMYDSFRDMCESGYTVDLYIYTTVDWPRDTLDSLESRIHCRHPLAQFSVSMVLKDPDVKLNLARYHKTLFHDNVDNYDLFIYSEDDHLVLLKHVTAYMEETRRLKEILGTPGYTDYSIGFIRYEINQNNSHTTFEWYWNLQDFNVHLVHNDDVDKKMNATYFTAGGFRHQGMYMATSEQFKAWSERPNCRFNDTTVVYPNLTGFPDLTREMANSVWLYSSVGCQVVQLVPTRNYHDFFIHHLPDKYVYEPGWPYGSVTEIGSLLPKSTGTTGLIKMIDERVSS